MAAVVLCCIQVFEDIRRQCSPPINATGCLDPIILTHCAPWNRNKVRYPTTIHVHGLLYKKDSEGSPYNDDTSGACFKRSKSGVGCLWQCKCTRLYAPLIALWRLLLLHISANYFDETTVLPQERTRWTMMSPLAATGLTGTDGH